MKRRELFSSLSSKLKGEREEKKELVVRPPYWDNGLFDKASDCICIECEDKACSKFCEEDIIKIGDDGTPRLDFSISGCTFCEECAKACPHGVLSLDIVDIDNTEDNQNNTSIPPVSNTQNNQNKINITVEIDVLKCLSWQKTMCFACQEPCLDNAINFLGMFRPTIDSELCTSCGFCISRCPTDAIKLKEKKEL